MEKSVKMVFFFVYIFVGLYLLNSALNFMKTPDFFGQIDKWIFLIGGFLLIIGGFSFLKASKKRKE